MLEELLRVSRGEKPADLVLKNARLVNVFSGEIEDRDVYIAQGHIVGFTPRPVLEEMDLKGQYLLPGFIDAHLHIESSYLTPVPLGQVLVCRGTTVAVCDPHEIANVAGLEGVFYFLREAEKAPCFFYFMAPSCVPASPWETAGAWLGPDEIATILEHPRVLGLAEVMNFPGTVAGDPELLGKIRLAQLLHKHIDGHAPGLRGQALEAYRLAGPANDHECTLLEEAREKLALGMNVFIRRGSVANHLKELLPLVTGENWPFFAVVSDDVDVRALLKHGHMDQTLREMVSLGLDPITAIRLVTLAPAQHYQLHKHGAVFPGAWANLVLVKDLRDFAVQAVWYKGRLVAKEGSWVGPKLQGEPGFSRAFQLPSPLDLRVPAQQGRLRVIGVQPGQILTEHLLFTPTIKDGLVVADPQQDLAKIVCIERHQNSGNFSVGFVHGFGLKQGALASTVAHDSHHLLVVGVNDEDMLLAAQELAHHGGGQIVVARGEIKAFLPLSVAGLMSTLPPAEVASRLEDLHKAVQDLGCSLPEPFMSLSFLALSVIPHLKITYRGLVDVDRFQLVPLFVEE